MLRAIQLSAVIRVEIYNRGSIVTSEEEKDSSVFTQNDTDVLSGELRFNSVGNTPSIEIGYTAKCTSEPSADFFTVVKS